MEMSELSEKPELHNPESRSLRAEYWRDRPGVAARLMGPMLVYVPHGVMKSEQAASKSKIRPLLLLTLMSVAFKCNVLPIKALLFINPWADVCGSIHTGPAVHQLQSDL